MGAKKRRVALVLGGGGARGIAHIGAIGELERRGFEIAAVAGTSMGALVGGMYAAGHLEPFREWMCALDRYKVFSLVDFAFSSEGLVKGDRVIAAMKELVPDVRIERMPLPFAAVAADLLTGREVVLDSGGLYDAIRASISIPSVFRPVRRDGMVLIDGGTVNPLPLNRVRREEGDLLIAVDVCAPFAAAPAAGKVSLNYYRMLTASSQIMQQHIAGLMRRLYRPDVVVPTASACSSSTVRRRSSKRGAGRPARRSNAVRPGTDMAWILLKSEKDCGGPFLKNSKNNK